MSSIDDLFRKPNAQSTYLSSKRKLETIEANGVYKSTKLDNGTDVKGHTNGTNTTVEDETNEDEDVEAGPTLPDDEPEDAPADEEGRFFGGGVTRDTTEALDYVDAADPIDAETIDAPWVRRLVTSLQRKTAHNARQRSKYADEPQHFMDSEADLDAEIKRVSILTEHTDLYSVFVDSKGTDHLVSLLAHENTDIAINAIEIIAELIADDVDVQQAQWDTLVNALLEADLLSLLSQNFERFDEADESDRLGVYHSLSVLEALASQATIADKAATNPILSYLVKRIQIAETPIGQNKQYAAEVLQVLLQASSNVQNRLLSSDLDAVEAVLTLLAAFRKHDPDTSGTEGEYAENLFDILACLVDQQPGRAACLKSEGIELLLIMLRPEGGKFCKLRAATVLDHALSGHDEHGLCVRFVQHAGLKPLFALFAKKITDRNVTEHCLGIFASLLRSLPGESDERIRLVAKFVEKDHAQIVRLLTVRSENQIRLSALEAQISAEQASSSAEQVIERASESLSRRLDAGLYSAQTVDVVLAWLAAEDSGARTVIQTSLGASLSVLRDSLQTQLEGVDDDNVDATAVEILRALIDAL